MCYKSTIYAIGDVHCDFNSLSEFIKENPHIEIILACGDFGYWPGHKMFDEPIYNPNTKIYFCDGNHENHDALRSLNNNEIKPNVFYQKRGSYITLPNGKNVLFAGGAESIDKQWRTPGYDWFPEETLKEDVIDILPNIDMDIIVSHTCPMEIDIASDSYEQQKSTDISRYTLSYIYKKYNPKQWYFGHWHKSRMGVLDNGCEWVCLNRMDGFNVGSYTWVN